MTMYRVTIDGQVISVPPGTTILQAARQLNEATAPPAMCYTPLLSQSGGKCRTCMVKVARVSEAQDRAMPRLVPSCRTEVEDGMVVLNRDSDAVIKARQGVVELLLINHPLDCPVCDQAGECSLQDLAFEHGMHTTQFKESRRQYPVTHFGDRIKLHMNRCILCYRCVYVGEEVTGQRQHGVMWRGDRAEISSYVAANVDNEWSGNMIDVCPVGALTDMTFRFKSRVWFTKPMLAHRSCDTCCGKAVLWLKGNEVLRVTARKTKTGDVAGFICNTCRYDTKNLSQWEVEGPAPVASDSVISQNHYTLPLPETTHD